jgi:hypothetical protein
LIDELQAIQTNQKRIEGEFRRFELGFASAIEFRKKVRDMLELPTDIESTEYIQLLNKIENDGQLVAFPVVLNALLKPHLATYVHWTSGCMAHSDQSYH